MMIIALYFAIQARTLRTVSTHDIMAASCQESVL